MRILLTGASSFTGSWFASTLAAQGHRVVATLQAPMANYEGLRGARLAGLVASGVELRESTSFGDDRFLALVGEGFDVIGHHGAVVTDYRSPDFDVSGAVAANTRNARAVIVAGKAAGLRALVVTGSVFESGEGAGEAPLRAFSAYGLSKALSWQVLAYQAESLDLPVGKFVIPNPFGIHEEPRFCAYLMRTWGAGKVAEVNTPDYVRDNIPVERLADAYARFAAAHGAGQGPARLAPSGYVESQGAFALRFAREIGSRAGIKTPLKLLVQNDFSEPAMRVNTDRITGEWDEDGFWTRLAAYYAQTYLAR